jgi:outer membrane protein assembly factor BamB
VWKFKTEGQVVSTPAHANGAIYFGSTDKHIYCLEARKGQLRWKFPTDGTITGGSTIADTTLYIGSLDKTLYALPI